MSSIPTDQEFAPTWEGVNADARPGTKIVGTLKDAQVRTTKYGKEFDQLLLDTTDGEISVPAWHYLLGALVREIKPSLGSKLEIEFLGFRELEGRNPMRLYSVNGVSDVDGGGGGRRPDWLNGEPPIVRQSVPSRPQPQQAADDNDDLPF